MQWQIGACFRIHSTTSNQLLLMSNLHCHSLDHIVADIWIFIPADCSASNLEMQKVMHSSVGSSTRSVNSNRRKWENNFLMQYFKYSLYKNIQNTHSSLENKISPSHFLICKLNRDISTDFNIQSFSFNFLMLKKREIQTEEKRKIYPSLNLYYENM